MDFYKILIPDYAVEHITLISVIIRIILAVILGGFIGLERGVKKHPAGFRTHILVCVGACLAMLTNEFVFASIDGPSDPTRMGAQVISGIGFLGVGTIFMSGRGTIKGLTTAAGLWASACVGLAIGVGFYAGGIAATVIILIVLGLLPHLEEAIFRQNKTVILHVEVMTLDGKAKVEEYILSTGSTIRDILISSISKTENKIILEINLRVQKGVSPNDMLENLSEIDDVTVVEAQ